MTTTSNLYDCFLSAQQRIATDTRKLNGGELFFALKGENFDGNRFAQPALEAGAAWVVVDDASVVQDERYLLVEDTLESLQQLALHHRLQFNIPILAITGSNGKTTTKELIAAVLSSAHKTHFTQGNFNNHIGVPLTLLAMPLDTEIAVIEMGANHIGEIAVLCDLAEPTHGLITNIGSAHLEGFGSLEGVRQGKSELYRYLAAHRGVGFVNLEEAFLSELAEVLPHKIEYHLAEHPSEEIPYYQLKVVAVSPRISAAFLDQSGEFRKIDSPLSGQHNLQNISTAIAVGKYFKVPAPQIVEAIDSYNPTNNRSQWVEKSGIRFYLDAYNANPSSMRASLATFATFSGRRKLAILGDMLELGASAEEEHLALAQYAQSLALEETYLVGPLFAAAAASLKLPHFLDAEALLDQLDIQNWVGAQVLVKGSRGMRLEQILG